MESQEGRISSPNISDTLMLVTKGGPDRREIEGSCLKRVACGDNRGKRSWREGSGVGRDLGGRTLATN